MKKRIVPLFILFFVCNVSVFAASDETYDKLKSMMDAMEMIDANYVSQTKPKDLIEGAIKGIAATLDPFSGYMDEKKYKEMKKKTEGSYGGIGLYVDTRLTVLPMPDTPACKAGIVPKDRIIKIDGKSTVGMTSDEAAGLMRGKVGKKIKLTIVRYNVLDPIEFNLVREKIKFETVKATMLDDSIAYIRLSEFNAQSAADIKEALVSCKKQGMKSLILDLRNNPGGLLDSAFNIINMFVQDKRLVLTTKGRDDKLKEEHFTSGNGEFSNLEFIILVNGVSASCSEVLSGAMQDFKRALIIGGNTCGKGRIQHIYPLSGGGALSLTVAKYYLPSGRCIDRFDDKNSKKDIIFDVEDEDDKNSKKGITPDIKIEVSTEDEGKLYRQRDFIFEKNNRQKSVASSKKDKIQKSAVNKEKDKNEKSAIGKEKNKDKKSAAVDKEKNKDNESVVCGKDKVEDKVLNKAIEIIKNNKIAEEIESSQYHKKENKVVEKQEPLQVDKKKK
jgi:carboxyl-terminal processing protease